MAKALVKILRQKILRKCSERQHMSWELFGGNDHFYPYKMAKTLVKILRQKNFQKMLRMLRSIMGIFWESRSFLPVQNDQCKNPQTKKNPKMIRMSRFIMGFFWGLQSFSTIQNGQNTCKNSQTKNFSENAQNVEIYHRIFFVVTLIFTHTKWPKHL